MNATLSKQSNNQNKTNMGLLLVPYPASISLFSNGILDYLGVLFPPHAVPTSVEVSATTFSVISSVNLSMHIAHALLLAAPVGSAMHV